MTQPQQPESPTLGDMVIEDLQMQIAQDQRYAEKCKELAIARSQYRQLAAYLQSKADVLGLTVTDVEGNPVVGVAEPVEERGNPETNGKVVSKETVSKT